MSIFHLHISWYVQKGERTRSREMKEININNGIKHDLYRQIEKQNSSCSSTTKSRIVAL